MSFDLYFAGAATAEYGITKFLYSQYNDRSAIKKRFAEPNKHNKKLFLDSGAWSAFTRNVVIDVDEYIDYINSNSDNITVVASVDVLPGNGIDSVTAAEKSWENFLYMRNRVKDNFKLIPVFHQSEPIKNLYKILEYEDKYGKIQYMGIGALANTKDKSTRDKFISECFLLIQNMRPDIKVHGFGMTDLELLELYPFYSADSTTWRMAAVMGEILTKWGRIVVSNRRKNDSSYSIKSDFEFNILREYVQSFGFDLLELIEDGDKRAQFNVCYLQNWEITRKCKYERVKKNKKLF